MLTPLTDLPAGVVGFEASGRLEEKDYVDVLQPALQQAAADGEVRVVIVMPNSKG